MNALHRFIYPTKTLEDAYDLLWSLAEKQNRDKGITYKEVVTRLGNIGQLLLDTGYLKETKHDRSRLILSGEGLKLLLNREETNRSLRLDRLALVLSACSLLLSLIQFVLLLVSA